MHCWSNKTGLQGKIDLLLLSYCADEDEFDVSYLHLFDFN